MDRMGQEVSALEEKRSSYNFIHKNISHTMAKKLYVGNLPFSSTDDALRELFSQAGAVETAAIIMDRMSGRSKGFGFVEMATEEEAQAAIAQFNSYEMDGRKLVVNEARPMEPRTDRPRRSFQPREQQRESW